MKSLTNSNNLVVTNSEGIEIFKVDNDFYAQGLSEKIEIQHFFIIDLISKDEYLKLYKMIDSNITLAKEIIKKIKNENKHQF
jgi:hypothetical protein